MKQVKNKKSADFRINILMKGVELLESNQNRAIPETINMRNFNFNIQIETNADAQNKLLFAIVNVEILSEDKTIKIGGISVNCIFGLNNFEEIIEISPKGIMSIPQPLMDIINSISISTTRGVMFATFKGTQLHHAFLPIIDPKQFTQAQ